MSEAHWYAVHTYSDRVEQKSRLETLRKTIEKQETSRTKILEVSVPMLLCEAEP